MTVVEGWFAGKSYTNEVPDMLDVPEPVRQHLELNIAMNSKVFLSLSSCLHLSPVVCLSRCVCVVATLCL